MDGGVQKEWEEEARLSEWGEGREGMVVGLEVGLEEAERLRTLGIYEGSRLRVVRAGWPMIVEVMRTRVGLCGSLAGGMRVRECGCGKVGVGKGSGEGGVCGR